MELSSPITAAINKLLTFIGFTPVLMFQSYAHLLFTEIAAGQSSHALLAGDHRIQPRTIFRI
jgi:hypothetical protein